MTSLEITGENAKEVVDITVGIFGPRIVVPVEGDKDESVYKVQKPKILQLDDLQTEEGLGEASSKNEAHEEHVEALIGRLYAAGNSIRLFAEGEDFENFKEIADDCFAAAKMLEVYDDFMELQFQNAAKAAVEIVKALKGETK